MQYSPLVSASHAVRALVLLLVVAGGCAETLPDEDRRIYDAVPAAKLSADILWKDYAADAEAADREYWGKALEVSGNVAAMTPGPPHVVIIFRQADEPGVEAILLDDEAEAITARVKVGDRITLRCFCEGLDGSVRLKSCIAKR